ncbi:MAG: hypothetical protein JEY91_00215 [Spirochaetaceae bacterium]|nr:hypothetical protein [Spirochaetaceae bacterium]
MDFSTAFKIAGLADQIGKRFYSAQKTSSVHKKMIMREIHENLDLITLWENNDFPIDKVIEKLSFRNYEKSQLDNFNFNSIKKSHLKEQTTRNVPQFRKYIGWSTEKLFENLYRKIKLLKVIIEMDSDNKKVNKSMRLRNIYKLMILILFHIE